jgi:hypothetical protein
MVAAVGMGGAEMVRARTFEVPPPEGLVMVTEAVPALAMSEARMFAVSWVLLTKVVVRGVPLTFTTAPLKKSEPATVNVKAPEPATTFDGVNWLATGGMTTVVKGTALETGAPEGLATAIEAVPAVATSAARMAAVSWVALTKVVVRAAPLKLTTAPLTKFEPLTVKVNAAEPAAVVDGASAVTIAADGLEV